VVSRGIGVGHGLLGRLGLAGVAAGLLVCTGIAILYKNLKANTKCNGAQ